MTKRQGRIWLSSSSARPLPRTSPCPTSRCCVAAICKKAVVAGGEGDFETLYASRGVAVLPTVLDGDCAFDVMLMMLGKPSSHAARKELRLELSDYLLARVGEPWMHDIMAVTQEVDSDDVKKCKLLKQSNLPLAPPAAPSAAVADQVASDDAIVSLDDAMNADPLPDEETVAALRWSSKLTQDANVLSLIQSLPIIRCN